MQLSKKGREVIVTALAGDRSIIKTNREDCYESVQELIMFSEYVDLHPEDEEDTRMLTTLTMEVVEYIFGAI